MPTMSAPRLDQRQLLLEPVGQADVVGVHPGDDLVVAGGRARGRGPGRGRRSPSITTWSTGTGLSATSRAIVVGQLVGHRAVLHQHHLVGAPGLVVHARGERVAQEVGVVAAVHREQQGERLARAATTPARRACGDQPASASTVAVGPRAGCAGRRRRPRPQARAQRAAVAASARTCAPSGAAVEPPYSAFSAGDRPVLRVNSQTLLRTS